MQYSKFKLVINSHINSKRAQEKLYANIISLRIHEIIDVIFVVGDSQQIEQKIDHFGIRWVYVLKNYVDFTGIICATDILHDDDCILYVHDTITFGSTLIFEKISYETKALKRYPSMNMGTYMIRDLKEMKDHLIKLYEHMNTKQIKTQCVMDEDIIFKTLGVDHIVKQRAKVSKPYDVYKTGTMRIQEYYSEIDLYKYKANWFIKADYELNN